MPAPVEDMHIADDAYGTQHQSQQFIYSPSHRRRLSELRHKTLEAQKEQENCFLVQMTCKGRNKRIFSVQPRNRITATTHNSTKSSTDNHGFMGYAINEADSTSSFSNIHNEI